MLAFSLPAWPLRATLSLSKRRVAKFQTAFLNGESKQSMARIEIAKAPLRQFVRMKKILVLSAVLLGTAVASRAGGIDVRIGLPLPPLPRIIIGAPAPHVIVHEPRVVMRPPVCAPAPVYLPPPVCAPPVFVPRRRVVYAAPHGYYRCHRDCRHGHHHRY
jgi:hypothetical protein